MSDLPDWTRSVAVEVHAAPHNEYWLAENGTFVQPHASIGSNTAKTLIKVNASGELYVLSGGLSFDGGEGAYAKLYAAAVGTGPSGLAILNIENQSGSVVHRTIASKMFVKVPENTRVYVVSSAGAHVAGYVAGYCIGSCECLPAEG